MSIKETIEAIKNIPDTYPGDTPVWAGEVVCSFADLRQLAEAYDLQLESGREVVRFFHQQGKEVPFVVREMAEKLNG